jgi:hypothetical protein
MQLYRGGRVRSAVGTLLAFVSVSPLVFAGATGQPGDAPAPSASTAPSASLSARPLAPRTQTVFLKPPPSLEEVTLGKALPDPPALVSKSQWVYDLRYAAGDLYLLGIHRVELAAPQATPRAMGRFAFELYEGATLLERARFDFPMLGDATAVAPAPEAGAPMPIEGRPISLVAKIKSRVGVMFPVWARGTRLEIVDRATNQRWPLPWPPVETEAVAPSAGTGGGGADAGGG